MVGRATRIRTKAAACGESQVDRQRIGSGIRRLTFKFKAYPELLGKPAHNLAAELCSVALLEHAQRGLMAADFLGDNLLREFRLSPGGTNARAYLWIQLFHRRVLWTLFYQLTRGKLSTISTEL